MTTLTAPIEALPESPLADRLTDLIESVECLVEDAADNDFGAVTDKLIEALAPLRSARAAAYQYTAGILPGPDTVDPFAVSCSECGSRKGEHCASGYGPTRAGAHYPRIERSFEENQKVQRQHREAVNRLIELIDDLG